MIKSMMIMLYYFIFNSLFLKYFFCSRKYTRALRFRFKENKKNPVTLYRFFLCLGC